MIKKQQRNKTQRRRSNRVSHNTKYNYYQNTNGGIC